MIILNLQQVEELIQISEVGRNTKFLSAAHNLWVRFHNYDKCPPIALQVDGAIVSLIFATFNKDGYTNLYDIVTVQGFEQKGYASLLWEKYINYAVTIKKSTRLKLSCTPSSITWHLRNGLLFWAVDPSGSLRSDQELFPTREKQIEYQNANAILPPEKSCIQFRKESLESHRFGKKKSTAIELAISSVGKYWVRNRLFESSILEDFLL